MEVTGNITASLKEQYNAYKEANPRARIRNAAKDLGVSELELLATGISDNATRLEGDWKELLKEIKNLGHVMALTRNDNVVHERKGVYNNVSFNEHVGLVLDADIDLRLFMGQWKFGYAVNEPFQGALRYSLQFFDKNGEAVHKIYLTEKSNYEAYLKLIDAYKSKNQEAGETVEPKAEAPNRSMPDEMVDVENFRKDWLNLKDTHDFYMLLGKYRVGRTQSLRLAPEGMAVKIGNDTIRTLLDGAAASRLPIMVFVGNKGCIQIHTGEITKTAPHENWYNVLDPEFNLHVNENAIHETWLVRKPTTDGIVTAVEIYDEKGELMVQFFGKRKPGTPEDLNWRAFADGFVKA